MSQELVARAVRILLGARAPIADACDMVAAQGAPMQLGAFSVSLAVKDLAVSRDFYAKLGFEPFAGDAEQGWLMLRNGDTVIGLFQGMFESNILTFNPGWDQSAANVDPFTDVRDIQEELLAAGVDLKERADESSSGPAYLTLTDPDGNAILIDQHR